MNARHPQDLPLAAAAPLRDALGRPLRDLRLSVIDRCNFRCSYCMPRESFGPDYPFLPASERLGFDEMLRLARGFVALGVEKIRLTGGEPLLRRGLPQLVERLAALRTPSGHPVEIALTTNGVLLAAQARALRDAGLARVTVSLDALDDALFRHLSGADLPIARVLDGIAAAQAAGLAPLKVNTVVERGVNEGEILPLVRHFRGSGVALRFIEYMDVGGASAWGRGRVVTADEVRARVAAEFPLRALPGADGGRDGATAQRFEHADGQGELGFIASVSQPFCGDCSRARVSSDGRLYTCLFATRGLDLRPWLAPDSDPEALQQLLATHWARRDDRYSERRAEAPARRYPTVRMSLVGG